MVDHACIPEFWSLMQEDCRVQGHPVLQSTFK